MAKAKGKQALVSIDVPSVLKTTVRERQTLRDAFQNDLEGVLKHDVGAAFDNDWNVGRVATEVVVVAGPGRSHAPRRKPPKKAAKK